MKIKNKAIYLALAITFLGACSVTNEKIIQPEEIVIEAPPKVVPPAIIIEEPKERRPLPPEPKKWVERKPLTNQQRFKDVLASHNRIRAKHRLAPLTWSNKLANYSQQWANQMARGQKCQMYHRSKTKFGENLFRSTAIVWSDGKREIAPVTSKQVIKAWTDEERWYDYSRNRCQPGQQCGHYTQVVWKSTKEVGCALKVCADKSQTWVCSYSPPGNYIGQRPY